MFYKERVIAALEAKADRLETYKGDLGDSLVVYEQGLDELSRLSRAEIEAKLAGIDWPGARPTDEHEQHPGQIIPFGRDWSDHQQARAWAREVLVGTPTVAVDGSQIVPSQEVSLPVGAVQIGWFVNPHDEAGDYVKDISFEVLAPGELAGPDEVGPSFPDWQISLRRFVQECEKLVALMAAARDDEVKPVCFFDGSLVISFAQNLQPERQRLYVEAVMALLAASEEYRVPLVGYVDTSYASDLVALLGNLTGRRTRRWANDGELLRPRMKWGDRTVAYECARRDQLLPVGGSKYYDQVIFAYLKTTAERPPARLDLPRWLLEAGELERVIDVVRAECVVGNGYPYAVETADAVAVITQRDREKFYRLFQEFARRNDLPLRFSRKAASKRGRR